MTVLRRLVVLCLLLVPLSLVVSCSKDEKSDAGAPAAAAADPTAAGDGDRPAEAPARKLVKTAELALQVDEPSRALDEARALAERFGGHLASSTTQGETEVRATLKVRAESFDAALTALRALGTGRASESVSSKDVTEEWVDLDARLRTKKRLEEQLLEILKTAKTVDDALAVHKQLGETRSEIERIEGKKKLIDHQVALATIELRLEKKEPLIALGGGRFGRALAQAGADAVNVGAAIVLGSIRAIGVLLPISLLLLLPLYLIGRRIVRRLLASTAPAA